MKGQVLPGNLSVQIPALDFSGMFKFGKRLKVWMPQVQLPYPCFCNKIVALFQKCEYSQPPSIIKDN